MSEQNFINDIASNVYSAFNKARALQPLQLWRNVVTAFTQRLQKLGIARFSYVASSVTVNTGADADLDHLIVATPIGTDLTVTLSGTPRANQHVIVKHAGTSFNVNVDSQGVLIDGLADRVLTSFQTLHVVYVDGAWHTI